MVGVARESNKTYIRNINSTGLNGAAVIVDVNTGLLGHATSSRHYKEEFQPMDQASESLADKLRVLRTSALFGKPSLALHHGRRPAVCRPTSKR
jgi:hypothetical protein